MGGEEDIKARLQSPSGLASSASSPLRGEPFFARASPARKPPHAVGRWPSKTRPEGLYPSAAVKHFKSSLCRGRRPRRPAGDADTPFTGACRAASPLAAAEGSRPLPANLPQKELQRQSYGPGMPGPYRTAKNTPVPFQKRRGVAYPCKIRPAYTAGR